MTKKNFNKLMHFSDIETAYKNDQYPDAECMLTYPGEVTDNRPFTPAGVNLKPVTITENGEYNPADFDADGFSWVTVDVEGQAEPVLEPLVCNYNGTFTPPEGVDGFNSVTTNIHPANPYVGNFTSNQTIHVDGEYNGVDITVDVDAITNELTVTENGTYTPPSGVDGFSEVVVNVPPSIPSDCIIVENTKICDTNGAITVNFERNLTLLEGYIVSIKDSRYTDSSINFFQYYRNDTKYFFLNKGATDSVQFTYTASSISANFQSYVDRWISIYKIPTDFYCTGEQI